jgi:transposase
VSKPHTPKPPYPAQFREQMIELVQPAQAPLRFELPVTQ